MPPVPAPRAASMPRSGIRAVMDAAWALDRPVIGMHVGEPDFDPPAHVIEAARRAYAEGDTHYVPNPGITALREAIAEKLAVRNGIEATPEQVIVSGGGAQALYLAFTATLQPGDEVLIPDPGWPNFAMAVQLVGAVPVRYPLRAENGFLPDPDELEALVAPGRTRMILVNSPSNPLGTVIDADRMRRIVRIAERHDLWLLSDECYDELVFGTVATSPASLGVATDRILSAFSFSKTYAMTGIRVGYLVVPPAIAPITAKLQEAMIACVNAPAQIAAIAALTGPQDAVEAMREAYDTRRRLATAALEELGIGYVAPQGAFYLWIDLSTLTTLPAEAYALELLQREAVAIAPGTAFGPAGEGWARLSLATATDDVLEGIARIGGAR